MKQFFTLIISMLFQFSLFAQPLERGWNGNNQNKISVTSLLNGQVTLMIDGNYYSARNNDDDITVSNLRAGNHTIRIYQQRQGSRKNPRNAQLLYDATIYLRNQYHVDVIVNRFGKIFVDERKIERGYLYEPGMDDNDNGWGQNGYAVMNDRIFTQFKQTLRNESFDNTRVSVAKQTIAANQFIAAQVKELLPLFSFEDNKLEIAEFAYKYTIDKSNYFILNDQFAFSGSKEELARYIQSYR